MNEQTPDPLVEVLAAHQQVTDDPNVVALCSCGVARMVRAFSEVRPWFLRHLAAAVRTSGAGLGGTGREQIEAALDTGEAAYKAAYRAWSLDTDPATERTPPQARRFLVGAVLALRSNLAPDDTADLRAEVERLGGEVKSWRRVGVETEQELIDTEAERDEARAALAAATAREDALREALDGEPLIVRAIRRDLEKSPRGRGGELRAIPATRGWGKSGCPGDNLTAWIDGLRAVLGDTITGNPTKS